MKSFWKSKTVWLAIGQAVAGGAGLAISPDPTMHAISWAALGKSALDVGLRMATNKGVTLGG